MGGYVPNYKQGYYSGENALIGFDNTFYISNAFQVWTNIGQVEMELMLMVLIIGTVIGRLF